MKLILHISKSNKKFMVENFFGGELRYCKDNILIKILNNWTAMHCTIFRASTAEIFLVTALGISILTINIKSLSQHSNNVNNTDYMQRM